MYGVYVYTTKCVLLSDFSQLNEIELKKKKKQMKIQNLISFHTLVVTCKYMNNTNSSVELMSECAHCSQPKPSKLHKYLYVFSIYNRNISISLLKHCVEMMKSIQVNGFV